VATWITRPSRYPSDGYCRSAREADAVLLVARHVDERLGRPQILAVCYLLGALATLLDRLGGPAALALIARQLALVPLSSSPPHGAGLRRERLM